MNARPAVLAALRMLTSAHRVADVHVVAVEAGVASGTARHHLGTLMHRGQATRERVQGRYYYTALPTATWRP